MSYIQEARHKHKRLARQMFKPIDAFYDTPMHDELRVESVIYALFWFCETNDIDLETCHRTAAECFAENKALYEAEDLARAKTILERY